MKPISIAFAVYSVTNLETSRAFYENVLGFTPENVWVDEETKTGMIEYGFGPDNIHTLAIGTVREGFPAGKNGGACVAQEVEEFEEWSRPHGAGKGTQIDDSLRSIAHFRGLALRRTRQTPQMRMPGAHAADQEHEDKQLEAQLHRREIPA